MAKFRVYLNEDGDVREVRSSIQALGVTDVSVDAGSETITFEGDETDRDAVRELEGIDKVIPEEDDEGEGPVYADHRGWDP